MPVVSICIPTYKQIECLGKCLDSVLMQDYKDFELIISDDTPDDSVKDFIFKRLNGVNFSYFHHQPSLGSPDNWNFAIENAKGDYIKIMHHDDFFTSETSLKEMVMLLDENPDVNLAFCAARVWYINRNLEFESRCSAADLSRIQIDFYYLFFSNLINAPSTTIYRNGLNLKFDERLKWLVDVDFYISLLENNNNVAYIDSKLVCITLEVDGQVTQQVKSDKKIQVIEHLLLFSKIISKVKSYKGFLLLFDELFLKYEVNSMTELKQICEVPENLNEFLSQVFANLPKFKLWKRIKYRLLNSKYNRYYFRIEKY
jgi:glycosyltransferase involved in cell wall biosynthesis